MAGPFDRRNSVTGTPVVQQVVRGTVSSQGTIFGDVTDTTSTAGEAVRGTVNRGKGTIFGGADNVDQVPQEATQGTVSVPSGEIFGSGGTSSTIAVPPGPQGPPGRQVTSFTTDQVGNVVTVTVTYSDDATQTFSFNTTQGVQGVSITNATITNGDLILTLSNGNVLNAGSAIGPQGVDGMDGRGITNISLSNPTADADGNNEYTINFTYTSGAPSSVTFEAPRGPTGPMGNPGMQGIQGERGERGLTGMDGPTGPPGPRGFTGETGQRGRGITDVTLGDPTADADGNNEYTGTITYDSGNPSTFNFEAPRGPVGPQGTQGERGMPGNTGGVGPAGPATPITQISNIFDTVSRNLTTTVNNVAATPVNIPQTSVPPTTVDVTFDGNRQLTVDVDGISDAVTIPAVAVPPTMVQTTFDVAARELTTVVDGVSDTTAIPVGPTTNNLAFNPSSRVLTSTINGVARTVEIPGGGTGPGVDTNTTYTFTDGTNGIFMVTPSDTGTAQTVSTGTTGGGAGFALVNDLSSTAALGTHQRTNSDFRGYARGQNAWAQVDGQTATELDGDFMLSSGETFTAMDPPIWSEIPTYFARGVFNG